MDLRPIVHDLVEMTKYTEIVYEENCPNFEDDSYMEYVNWRNLEIEHRTLSISFEEDMTESIRLACLLYGNTVLIRGYPLNSAVIQTILRAFKQRLEGCLRFESGASDMTEPIWTQYADTLLWLSFMGAFCSYILDDQSYFERLFKGTTALLGLHTIRQAHDTLSGFLFVDRVYSQKLVALYNLH